MNLNSMKYEQRKLDYFEKIRLYLDTDFLSQIEQESHRLQRESELILGHEFLKNGYNLQRKSKNEGPDFLLTYGDRRVWVEVVTPSGRNEERFGSYLERESDQAKNKLGIASAISSKKSKFDEYQKGENSIVFMDDIKIICVNVYYLRSGSITCSNIANAVYGIKEAWLVDTRTYKLETDFLKHEPITKANGAIINMGLFDQNGYQEIDGVLWFDYSLGTICPERCNMEFLANKDRRGKIGNLFSNWKRIFYEDVRFPL